METFNLFSLLGRRWPTIIFITLIVFGAAYLTSSSRPVGVVSSLVVQAVPVREYLPSSQVIIGSSAYDDSQLLGKLADGWVTDPSLAQSVLSEAGAKDLISLRTLTKSFRVSGDAVGVGNFQVQYSSVNSDQAQLVATSLEKHLNSLGDQYNSAQGEGLKIRFIFGDLLTNSGSGSLPLTPIVGLIAGFALAVTLAAMQDRPGTRKE
jgi:hypothetical protein